MSTEKMDFVELNTGLRLLGHIREYPKDMAHDPWMVIDPMDESEKIVINSNFVVVYGQVSESDLLKIREKMGKVVVAKKPELVV